MNIIDVLQRNESTLTIYNEAGTPLVSLRLPRMESRLLGLFVRRPVVSNITHSGRATWFSLHDDELECYWVGTVSDTHGWGNMKLTSDYLLDGGFFSLDDFTLRMGP